MVDLALERLSKGTLVGVRYQHRSGTHCFFWLMSRNSIMMERHIIMGTTTEITESSDESSLGRSLLLSL